MFTVSVVLGVLVSFAGSWLSISAVFKNPTFRQLGVTALVIVANVFSVVQFSDERLLGPLALIAVVMVVSIISYVFAVVRQAIRLLVRNNA